MNISLLEFFWSIDKYQSKIFFKVYFKVCLKIQKHNKNCSHAEDISLSKNWRWTWVYAHFCPESLKVTNNL